MLDKEKKSHKKTRLIVAIFILLGFIFLQSLSTFAVENPQSGGLGMEGRVSSDPPNVAPSISVPTNGQVINQLPVTVSGICSGDLLIKLFKNNVFSGSAQCINNSYSIITDLFNGSNDLLVRAFDDLDQSSPDSNLVTVSYAPSSNFGQFSRVFLSSNYAKRGANPNEVLSWPLNISGGRGPYAISVDWGDTSKADVYSVPVSGEFIIRHQYQQSGRYVVLVKAVDVDGNVAYLQLTAIANGPLKDGEVAGAQQAGEKTKIVIPWQPIAVMIPLSILTFWVGRKYELTRIKNNLSSGKDPF